MEVQKSAGKREIEKMKHICFIVNRYPNIYEPYMLVFLQRLAWSMADMGKKVTVICPLQINLNPEFRKLSYYEREKTEKGEIIEVYRPKTIGLGQSHLILGKSPVAFTTYFMEKAAEKVLKEMKEKPDVLYGHFLAPAGIIAVRLGKKFQIPAFFAFGEAHDTVGQFGAERACKELRDVCGVIAVSTHMKKQLVHLGVVSEDKIQVFPNAVDERYFYPHDQAECREKFGLPADGILAAFVGSFDERKGIDRVCLALEQTEGIRLICAGKGDMKPSEAQCVFARPVAADKIPEFNSAADMFVLPTLNEGCCNAVVEAMACGLPIISSNLEFNDDILTEECSIRINPNCVEEIAGAMQLLANDAQKRKSMSEAAVEHAKLFTLNRRARNIISYIDTAIEAMNQAKTAVGEER